MAIRLITCHVAVCDLCGATDDTEGGTPHFATQAEAIDYATADPDGWTLTDDGRLICTRDDRAHERIHEDAGKRISACAMTVTWPRR
ncbi:hypothetical protein [Streptomyces sparsus]